LALSRVPRVEGLDSDIPAARPDRSDTTTTTMIIHTQDGGVVNYTAIKLFQTKYIVRVCQ